MKKSVLLFFLAIFMSPISLLANSNSLFSDNTPVQSFHQAGVDNAKSSSSKSDAKTGPNDAAAMAQVKAIMQAAKEEQQKKIAAPAPQPKSTNQTSQEKALPAASVKADTQNKPQNNPAAIFVTQKPINSTSDGSSLTEASQGNAYFANQTQQKLGELMNRNAALEAQIEKLKEAMILLNQEVNQMNDQLVTTVAKLKVISQQATAAPAKPNAEQGLIGQMKSYLGNGLNYVIYGAVALVIVLLLVLLFGRKGKSSSKKAVNANTDTNTKAEPSFHQQEDLEGDYDYMSSEQAIPAKLDLARSYLAMEDYSSARKVLQEILLSGTEDQRQTAETILQEMPS